MARLYFFPNIREAAPKEAPLVAAEVALLRALESSIAPSVTIGAPDFLDALEAMLLKHAARARQLAAERRNPKE